MPANPTLYGHGLSFMSFLVGMQTMGVIKPFSSVEVQLVAWAREFGFNAAHLTNRAQG